MGYSVSISVNYLESLDFYDVCDLGMFERVGIFLGFG